MLTTDIEPTTNFYRSHGFRESGRWDDYLIIRRDQAELHFFLEQDRHHAAGCHLRISDAPAPYEERSDVDGARIFPLTETDYGPIEFAIHNPDGHQILVGSATESER